jgi:hypothetical protein
VFAQALGDQSRRGPLVFNEENSHGGVPIGCTATPRNTMKELQNAPT